MHIKYHMTFILLWILYNAVVVPTNCFWNESFIKLICSKMLLVLCKNVDHILDSTRRFLNVIMTSRLKPRGVKNKSWSNVIMTSIRRWKCPQYFSTDISFYFCRRHKKVKKLLAGRTRNVGKTYTKRYRNVIETSYKTW